MNRTSRRWTPEEDAYLVAHWATTRSEDCARALNRTLAATYERARGLELRKRKGPVAGSEAAKRCGLRRKRPWGAPA